MGAIPCEQVVHAVNHADGDMRGICQCSLWKRKAIDQCHGDIVSRRQWLEDRDSVKDFKTPFRCLWVTTCSFE